MAEQGTPSIVEYALAFLILLLVGVALLTWLQPVLSNPAIYRSPGPMRGVGW
jgi:hypothetical protein